MNLRIAVVEDDSLTRLALVAALSAQGIQVVIESATAAEAVEASKTKDFEVAILDLHLGDGPTGLDVAHAFRRKNTSVGLVFLTSFDDPRLLSGQLPSLPGGSQYVTKDSVQSVDTLLSAVRLAASGKGATAQPNVSARLGALTDLQLETLKLVAQGLSNSEIAKTRHVTERSVEVSISRIAKALRLPADSTRNQRVHMAKAYFRSVGGFDL